MPDLLINDIDQSVIDKLTFRAAMERSTLEIEVHKALREAAERPLSLSKPSAATNLERARTIRAENTRVQTSDSVDLLREDRDR